MSRPKHPPWQAHPHLRPQTHWYPPLDDDIFSALEALQLARTRFDDCCPSYTAPPNPAHELDGDLIPLHHRFLPSLESSFSQFHLQEEEPHSLSAESFFHLQQHSPSSASSASALDSFTFTDTNTQIASEEDIKDQDQDKPSKRISIGSLSPITTYAEATNLAKRYPELASAILALPLVAGKEEHTADRPNWAVAPSEEEKRKGRRRRGKKGRVVLSSA